MSYKRKTKDETVTGIVERVEIKSGPSHDPNAGRYGSEESELWLDVAVRTDDDVVVYFKAGRVRRTIRTGGPIAVCLYWNGFAALEDGADNGFLRVTEGDPVARAGQPNTNRLESVIAPGDRITVRGRVKLEKTSRKGEPYRVLTHVKRANQ